MFLQITKSISILLIFALLGGYFAPLALAATEIVPTVYCVGGAGAPPCAPLDQVTTAPTQSASNTLPTPIPQTTSKTDPVSAFAPCLTEGEAQSNSSGKKRNKHRGGFLSLLIEFLIRFIEFLISGGTFPPQTNPNPDEPDPDPDPCDPTVTPEPTEGMEPTTSVPTTAQPTTIVTGTQPTTPVGSTSCTQADIQTAVNSVSQANIEANLKKLVQDDSKPTPNELISRHVSSPGNQIKVDWAKQQMTSYGLQIIDQPFSSGGHNLQNVVARVNGSDPNSLYAVGGHIDAISEDPENIAPGADDDGSGVVVAMEAGRALKSLERCLKSSVDFIGFNDEEEEMNGSATYVESLSGKTLKGAYNMDMVGYAPSGECLKSDVKESARDQVMAQKIVDMNTKYNIGLNVTTGTYEQNEGDDLAAFWNANYPGAYLIECATEAEPEEYPGYHKTSDTTNNVNIAQLTKTAKLLVAALAELASQ